MGVQKSELCGLTGNNHVILQTPRYPHRGVGSVSEVSWALPAQGEAGVSVRRRSASSFGFSFSPGIEATYQTVTALISKASWSLLVGHHIWTLREEHLRIPRDWGRAGPGNAKTWLRKHIEVTGVSGRMMVKSWSRSLARSLSVGFTNQHGG